MLLKRDGADQMGANTNDAPPCSKAATDSGKANLRFPSSGIFNARGNRGGDLTILRGKERSSASCRYSDASMRSGEGSKIVTTRSYYRQWNLIV